MKPGNILFLSCLLASCRPDPIEVELQQAAPRLVVHSQFLSEHELVIGLSRSFSLTKGGNKETLLKNLVADGEVSVVIGSREISLFQLEDGLFGGMDLPSAAGQTITLKVKDHSTGLGATAYSTMKKKLAMDSIRYYQQIRGKDTAWYFDAVFADPAAGNDFFVFTIYDQTVDSLFRNNRGVKGASLGNFYEENGNVEIFDDKAAQGNRLRIHKKVPRHLATDTLYVGLANVEEQYADFARFQKRYGSLLNQASGEIVRFPTNIQQGYGYFSAHLPGLAQVLIEK